MMLGGVGFQAGLDEVRRKQMQARRQAVREPAPNVVTQLKELKALVDDGDRALRGGCTVAPGAAPHGSAAIGLVVLGLVAVVLRERKRRQS